jgi:hypothetical protein
MGLFEKWGRGLVFGPVLATWDIRSKKEGFCQKIDDQNALELHFSRTDIPSSQYRG